MRSSAGLGGSWFLGRTVVTEALARGWSVTTFGADTPGMKLVGETGPILMTWLGWIPLDVGPCDRHLGICAEGTR